MTARDDLLAALTAERYDNRWWTTPQDVDPAVDTDLSRARRRHLMSEDFDRLNTEEREAR
jgi:hypothetical protein